MKLQFMRRPAEKKSQAKQLRRDGYITGVVYSKGSSTHNIAIKANEYDALLRSLPKGRLSTAIITLQGDDGSEIRGIVKEIQYHITTYNVINIDFEELHDDTPINVKVPLELAGIADCVGIKLGGVPRQVIRQVRIRCLPRKIPETFVLDISALSMKQSLRLSNIVWPEGVRPLDNLNEVAVVIAKK